MSNSADLFRILLAILDSRTEQEEPASAYSEPGEPAAGRFKQIFAMLDNPSQGPLANSPNEIVSNIDSVTFDAGGGVNGPKHPADIRVKDPRGFE